MMSQESVDIQQTLHHRVLIAALIIFTQDLSSGGGAQAWNYNYSISPNRRWLQARQWCQEHFTDMVTIQSQEETDFINNLLPFNPKYYWIGVRRVDGAWIRVMTNETVPEDAQNWAPDEPDDLVGQDCVEIYLKREIEVGMWNNEKCSKRKGTVCYSASCTQDSCSAHAECVETVGNHTCQCHPGFHGPRCEEAIECKPLLDPEQGSHQCFCPYGCNRFNSSCSFHCELGFHLVGVPQLLCQTSGHWNHRVPLCQVEQCPVLNHTNSSGGRMNCSHPIADYSYNSTCEVRCDEGYELSGDGHIRCDHTGQWTASVPECTVVQCNSLDVPPHASIQCQGPLGEYSYGSICTVQCEEGFELIGTNKTKCSSQGDWSHALPLCQAKRCIPPNPPSHGSISCSDPNGSFRFGSRCTSTCDEGFLLNGTSSAECTSLGSWNADIPRCPARTCPTLNSPTNGSLSCSHPHGEFRFGSRCTSACVEGFLLNGTADTECTSVGSWNADTPLCTAKTCPALNPPSRGSLSCSDPHGEFRFGSQCTSDCEEGFVLNGTTDTECTSLGTWSTEPPHCLARPCPLLAEAPQHGRMNCSHPHSPFSYDSHCDFGCTEGFWLRGTPTVTCNSSGHWSRDLPTCELVQCEVIRAPSLPLSVNCYHPLGNFSFGSQCLFTCKGRFSLNGTEVLLCSSTGFWSDDLPNCTEDLPVGAAMLMYPVIAATSVLVPLALIGLAALILTQFKRKGNRARSDGSLWEERENPAFEF
ncbi:P-selectin isoform X3 [Platichthys flesus]|uniref:P-selectin isoform X3 n=1 Tax=Platichthys flesus TaxID=8260 RepID=UPI002DBF4758|nr:P-selectin isoform X3 [Platichthys flesus]